MSTPPDGVRPFSIAETTPEPWKNGRGITRTISSKRSENGTIWRISVADIEKDGPFSVFPGIDRVSVLMGGPGLRLVGDGLALNFPEVGSTAKYCGEAQLEARLGGSPARFLNILTQNNRATAQVLLQQRACSCAANRVIAVVVLLGMVTAKCQDGCSITLHPGEGLEVTRPGIELDIDANADSSDACWAVITLSET